MTNSRHSVRSKYLASTSNFKLKLKTSLVCVSQHPRYGSQRRLNTTPLNSSSSSNFCNVSKMQLIKIEAIILSQVITCRAVTSPNISFADRKHQGGHWEDRNHQVCLALSPGPLRGGEKAWYTVCMCYFPSKHWEFVFLSIYFSVNVTHRKPKILCIILAKDTYCDKSNRWRRIMLTENWSGNYKEFQSNISIIKSESSTDHVDSHWMATNGALFGPWSPQRLL